jgi:hypothetical protein
MSDSGKSREHNESLRKWRKRFWVCVTLVGVVSSITAGIGVQGLIKGGSARTLGVVLTVASLVVAGCSFAMARGLSEDEKPPKTRPGFLHLLVEESDVLGTSAVVLAAVALVVLAVIGARLNDKPGLSYRSAYDGVDPFHGGCANAKGQSGVATSVDVRADGRKIGVLELEYSAYCGTHWAWLYLDRPWMSRARGSVIHLSVLRPIDNTVARYALPVAGADPAPYAFGNMVGGGTCAVATVWDRGLGHVLPAFRAVTKCRDRPSVN